MSRYLEVATGKILQVSDDPNDRAAYRLRKRCYGFEVFAFENRSQLYFLTLTLALAYCEATNQALNKFENWMRARFRRVGLGGKLKFLWVPEVQLGRYRKSGVAVLHWHLVIAAPAGTLPDCFCVGPKGRTRIKVRSEGRIVTSKALKDGWGRGRTLCMECYSGRLYGYLSKYMGKDFGTLSAFKPEWKTVRRFGSSQLGADGYPLDLRQLVLDRERECPDLRLCYRSRRGNSVVWLARSKQRVLTRLGRWEWADVVVARVAVRSSWIRLGT